MSRTFLTIFLLFCVSYVGNSQPIKQYGAKIGIANATWNWKIGGSTYQAIKHRLGVDLCTFVEWFQIPTFSLISELHFVQKGMKEDVPITTEQYPNGTGEFIKNNVRLDYLSFTVFLKFRLDTETAEFYAIAGFRVDVSLSYNVTVEGREPLRTSSAQFYQYLVDRFKAFQLGGTVGIGASFGSLLSLPIGIELRYSPNIQSAYTQSIWDIKNTSSELLLTISN